MAVATSSEPQLKRGQDDEDELEESVTQAERDLAHKEGNSLPDKSYPIRNVKQLHAAAVLAASGHGDVEGARALIRRRARDLGVDVNTLPGFGKPKPKVKAKGKASARESVRFTIRESGITSKAGSAYDAVLLREGPGNEGDRNYYTKPALQKAVADGLFENLQCYANHPSRSEERDRPERDVRHLIGSFREARYVEDGGVGQIRAKFVPIRGDAYAWVSNLIESALEAPGKPLIGLSIDGSGSTEPGTVNGRDYHMVREITRLSSADVVTRAGAGGRFVRRLSEAWRDAEAGAGDDLVLTAAQVQERVRDGVVALVGALATEDDGLARDAILRLHEAGHATVPKPLGQRGKSDSKLRERLQRADEKRRLAEAETSAITERARLAARLVGRPDIPAVTRCRWFDSLLEQPDEASMRETLGRLEEERRDELAALRESLTPDYGIEGAGRRQPASPETHSGGGDLLDRMGIDRDELAAA